MASLRSASFPTRICIELEGEEFGFRTGFVFSDEDLAQCAGCGEAGPFRLTTIGQAFHWMDRDEVLRKLAILTTDGGGLALVNPGKRRPQESWEPLAKQIVSKFLEPRPRHPKSNPQEPEHEPALRRTGYFSKFTTHEFLSTITRDINSIVGCIYSTSSSARPLFGDNAEAFEAELSKALLNLNPAGVFNEHVETEVIIAPRRAR